jgi:periplasmic protein TonB
VYANVKHAGRSTRVIGIAVAALMTAGAGWVFSEGIRQDFMPMLEKRTELVMIAPEEEPLPLPVEKEEPIKEAKLEQPELVAPDIPFVPPEPVITAPPAPEVPVAVPTPGPVNTAGSDRVAPKLQAGAKPEYPVASIRASEQGTTHLEVCVTDKGRVQSVTVAESSGSPRLDQAAAKWLRSERFTPGMVGGVPQPMCGHDVYYKWNLEDART